MTTARDIVTRALRKSGVVGHGQAAEASNASEALDDLNMMLAAWKLAAVDIEHTPLDLNATFPLAAEFEEGTVYMLSARLNIDFQYPVRFDPDDFFRKIQAAYAEIDTVAIPAGLATLPSQRLSNRWYSS